MLAFRHRVAILRPNLDAVTMRPRRFWGAPARREVFERLGRFDSLSVSFPVPGRCVLRGPGEKVPEYEPPHCCHASVVTPHVSSTDFFRGSLLGILAQGWSVAPLRRE